MSAHTEELLDLAAAYALGALDGSDLDRFEAHLAEGCEECALELGRSLETADALVGGLAPVSPSSETLDRLLERARSEEPDAAAEGGASRARGAPPLRRRSRARSALPIAASLAGVGILIGLSLELRSVSASLEAERSALLSERAARQEAERAIAGVREDAARLDVMMGTATAPTRREVALTGTGELPDAQARAIVDPETGGLILVVDNLPPLPEGKTYQLWVIVEGAPVSVGIFDLEADGTTRFGETFEQELSPGVTIAVSIEPDGGVPQPTGPIVLVGT